MQRFPIYGMLFSLCACSSSESSSEVDLAPDMTRDAAVDRLVENDVTADAGHDVDHASPWPCKKTYGMSFPPFSSVEQMDFTVDQLAKLGMNRIRIAINWKNREPSEGQYNWAPFDSRIQKAKENGVQLFLTIPSDGPDWACSAVRNDKSCVFASDEVFEQYLTTLLDRYPDIDKIQFGNEWDVNYAGSMEEFVRFNNILYDLTKKMSPNTKVVLGGLTRGYPIVELVCNQGKELDYSDITFADGWSEEKVLERIQKDYCESDLKERVLYVLMNARYEMIDIHLYDDALNWPDYVAVLPKGKGIIASEFGGPSSVFEVTDQAYQAKKLELYLQQIEASPIVEAYHFKLVDSDYSYHKHSGLFDDKLQKKQAYDVFARCVSDPT